HLPSMASPVSQKLEEKLQCSICLELFRVPVTLPCGHNFCERCIDNHRNKQEQTANGARRGYTCPECRYSCERHLELKKNVTLSDVVELARGGRVRAEGCEVPHVGQSGGSGTDRKGPEHVEGSSGGPWAAPGPGTVPAGLH
uniref:RING-type domain-containing protein n=1 Tax=Pavo cristatus TaxID=9049 RepID=A0A8C9EP08_PAVCR